MTKSEVKRLHDSIEKCLINGPAHAVAYGSIGEYPFLVGYYESQLKQLKSILASHIKNKK